MISVSRIHHQPEYLFGSDVEHMNTVVLRIHHGEHIRDETLHRDIFNDTGTIIEVQMTEQQFAAMITTMNVSGGSPCTISRLNGKTVAKPPKHRQQQVFERELRDAGTKMTEELTAIEKELESAIETGKLNKTTLRDLLKRLHYAQCAVKDNLPFLYRQYHETLDNAARDAETALHGRLIGVFQQLGLDNVKSGNAPKLLGNDEEL